MRILTKASAYLCASGALVLLTGCSTGGPPPANLATDGAFRESGYRPPIMLAKPGFLSPETQLMLGDRTPADAHDRRSTYVAVSEFSGTSTSMYLLPDRNNAPPQCTTPPTQYVNGIGIDSQGTLYVPQGGIDEVTTYDSVTCEQASRTLSDPIGQPGDIAFGSNGIIYVSDILDNAGGASIQIYDAGATIPSGSLSNPTNITEVLGVAVDKADNVYESYINRNQLSGVREFRHGKMPGKFLHLKGNKNIFGLTFDHKSNLIAVDDAVDAILVYAPPYSGHPTRSFPTIAPSAEAKLDHVGSNLYVGDFTNGTVDVYAYPEGTYKYSISNGLSKAASVEGVAVRTASDI